MGEKSTCEVFGAIRLTPKQDGIGIPVFSHRSDNYLYVAETDENLSITRFAAFIDSDRYQIDQGCVGLLPRRSYAIGEPVFVPFWQDGSPHAIAGDISLADFNARFPPSVGESNILIDVREVVSNSRTGAYAERLVAVDYESFRHEYGDIFIEPPTNTKYWISRYRSAAQRVQSNPRFSNSTPNRQLRRRVADWLSLYFHKGEFRYAVSMLEASSPSILTSAEVRFVLFYQLTERMIRGFGAKTPIATYIDVAKKYFRNGIYHYFTWEQGAGIDVDVSLLDGIPSLVKFDAADLMGFFRSQLTNRSARDLRQLHAITTVMFGEADAPRDISDAITHLYFSKVEDVERMLDMAYDRISQRHGDEKEWPVLASAALDAVRDLEIVQRTFNAELRFADPDITRLRLDQHQLRYLTEASKRIH